MWDRLGTVIMDAASALGRVISLAISQTDRQRINIRSTNILYHGAINSTSWTSIYEVGDNAQTEITEILVANTQTSGAVEISLALVPEERATAIDEDIIFPQVAVQVQENVRLELNTSITEGWSIQVRAASGFLVNLHISGVEKVN